ncbi:2-phospho-L-lactate transferase [Streptomyces sp. 900105755]
MRVTVLAGGIGGARFLRGLKRAIGPAADITVIGNTADDIDLFGLRVCPDLDTVMYTLGGGIDEEQGWGRAGETWSAKEELAAYGEEPAWFGLGDKDLATHLVRTRMLAAGRPLSAVTEALCARWQPGVRLLPMTDDRVETHIVIEQDSRQQVVHLQEYWVRLRAQVPARAVVPVGAQTARPAPGVAEAIAAADVILFAPSNPVVSIGAILAVPGIRAALTAATAPVVGLSPIIGSGPVRGMADQVLKAVGVAGTASAVAGFHGSRRNAGVLDGWLIDTSDAEQAKTVEEYGIACRAVPLWMTDPDTTAVMARDALDLAKEVSAA